MKEKIIKLIEDVLKVPAGTITEDTMIEDVEQWDSLAHVMIIGQLEEELGVSIPLDEAIDLKGMRELLEKAGCEWCYIKKSDRGRPGTDHALAHGSGDYPLYEYGSEADSGRSEEMVCQSAAGSGCELLDH